ncbi:MAG: glycosyl hydrolase [Planctomycetota bacterium]|nr:glycosyl hydrolase [Planctomycetota bacterium]
MPRIALSVLLVAAAGYAHAQVPLTSEQLRGLTFRSLGPCLTTGRIADLEVSPHDPDLWFLASASGGLFRSEDGGDHWAAIFDAHEGYSLGCVVVDPRDRNVVWLGTGENTHNRSTSYGTGVYKSLDGGDTWSCVGLTGTEKIQEILIDPRDSEVVYVVAPGPLWRAGGERGLYKTVDGGETWTRALHMSDDTGITDAAFRPGDPDVIYAAAYQRRRHNAMCVAGGPEAGILRSTDAGATWRRIEVGLPDVDMGRIALAVDPRAPLRVCATVVARGEAGGTFVSEDGGDSWTKHSDYAGGDPQYYGELFVDPHRPDTLWNVDVRVMRSTDLGRTWGPLPFAMHVDNHEVVFDPADPAHVWIGNDGGLYETHGYDHDRPQAARWRHFTNLPLSQFYRVSCDLSRPFYRVTGGAQDNGTIAGPSRSENRIGVRTSDWFTVGGGDGFQAFFDPTRSELVYGQSQNGALYRLDLSTGQRAGIRPTQGAEDGGRWHWDSPLLVSRHADGRLYYAGERVYRSDDRGDGWTAISGDLTRNLDRTQLPIMGKVQDADAVGLHLYTTTMSVVTALDESPRVPGLLYAGSDDGLVHVTENGGRSWTRVERLGPAPEQSYVTDLFASALDDDVVFATVNNWQLGDFRPWVLRSDDRGRTWTDITGNLPQRSGTWSIVQDGEAAGLLFVGTEFGVYVTIDGGGHWTLMEAGMPRIQARDLHLQAQWHDLVVGTFGRGIFVLDDISALRDLTPDLLASEAALLRCRPAPRFEERREVPAVWGNETAPNPPFGATLTYYVGAALGDRSLLLAISDAAGETVRELELAATTGLHRVTWDLRNGGRGRELVSVARYAAQLMVVGPEGREPIGEPQEVWVTDLER